MAERFVLRFWQSEGRALPLLAWIVGSSWAVFGTLPKETTVVALACALACLVLRKRPLLASLLLAAASLGLAALWSQALLEKQKQRGALEEQLGRPVRLRATIARWQRLDRSWLALLEEGEILSPSPAGFRLKQIPVYLPEAFELQGWPRHFEGWIGLRSGSATHPLPMPFQEARRRWSPHFHGVVKDMRLVRLSDVSPEWGRQLSEGNRQLWLLFTQGQPSTLWRDRLNPFGLGHLLSISGLHCAFFALLLNLMLFWLRHPAWKALALALGMAFYARWMGWSASVLRAAFMLALWQLMPLFSRTRSWPRLWCVALFVFVAADPLCLTRRGVWLTFSACLGLMVGRRPISDCPLIHPLRRKFAWLSSLLGAQMMVIPIGWCFEGRVFPSALLWNLLALPMLAVLLLLSLLCGLSLPFPALSGLANYVEGLLQLGLLYLSRVPSPAVLAFPAGPQWLLPSTVMMALALKRLPQERRWLAPLLLLLCWRLVHAPMRQTHSTVLDVGQGSCFLHVHEDGMAWLFDAGGRLPNDLALTTLLGLYGAKELDAIFLSHFNEDHYNLVAELPKGVPVFVPWTQRSLFEAHPLFQGRHLNSWRAGDHRITSGCTLEALWPEHGASNSFTLNDSGLVLLLRHRHTLWLAGDAGEPVERLVKTQAVDGLLAGHHGSRTASSEQFLRILKPRWTLISCGQNNRFGHPHPEVLKRLEELMIPAASTAQHGSITLTDGSLRLNSRK